MNSPNDFDKRLTDWLDDQAPVREPEGLTYAVLARTRRTRRLPGWASLERWLPMAVITQPALAPPLRVAWLLIVTLLVVALAAGTIVVGSRLLASSAVIPSGGEAVYVFGSFPTATEGGEILTVRADGTDVRQLTQSASKETHPSWSPDGSRIAFWDWDAGVDSVAVMDTGEDAPYSVFATEAYSNSQQFPTGMESSTACNSRRDLDWSPDGSAIVFTHRARCVMGYELVIAPANGSAGNQQTRLIEPGLNGAGATWSPDGTKIAFLGQAVDAASASRRGVGDVGLYVVDATPDKALAGGLTAQRIGPALGSSLNDMLGQPRWSPDGSEIAVVSRDGTSFDSYPSFLTLENDRIIAVKANGSGDRLVAEFARNPAWSPDGRHLAFQRPVDPAEYWLNRPCTMRIWIIDANGSNERQLDDLNDGCEMAPSWSPDGSRLATTLIDTAASEADGFHLGFVAPFTTDPTVMSQDATAGAWQPVVAPLP